LNVRFHASEFLPAVVDSPRTAVRLITTGLCCLLLVILAGCPDNRQQKSRRRLGSMSSNKASLKHLNSAIDYANRMDEFEEELANVQVAYHLNRWVDDMELTDDWSPIPLSESLPRSMREGVIADLGRPQFYLNDVKSLMQSVWSANIAEWVSRAPVLGPLGHRSQAHAEELEDFEVDQLTVAERLFDWTIRNIQLETTIPYPFDPVELTTGAATIRPRLLPPPMRAIPGPGYQTHPWQTLLYGRGDALARARVFIQLARQQGVDVVMLAFPGLTTPPRPRPWVPAVLIRDQLYLFDTEMGLALPGPNDQGIATLEQVKADPKLLSKLSVGTEHKYRVVEKDLKEVLVLVDASAQDLSRRMQLVQQNLSTDNRLVLTVPTDLSERLGKCVGVEDIMIWPISYETTWYQKAIEMPDYLEKMQLRARDDPKVQHAYLDKYVVLGTRNQLVQARHLHFRSNFDIDGDEKGAKTLYLDARIPNAQLDNILTSKKVQRQLGLMPQKDEREIFHQARLRMAQMVGARTKHHASYWLGLAQYDDGRPVAAVEWFARRTLEAFPDGPWTGGARYNLGRTYEALGKIEEAREQYFQDESPQKHGNLLRSRYLARTLMANESE
jgi:hypothetical protein